jgi:hypothetical protein
MPRSVLPRAIGCEAAVSILLILGLWVVALALSVPLLAVVVLSIGAGRFLGWLDALPILERTRGRAKAHALHRRLQRAAMRSRLPTAETFATDIRTALSSFYAHLSPRILDTLASCARTLYEAEGLGADIPVPPIQTELDAAKYHDEVLRRIDQLRDPTIFAWFRTSVLDMLRSLCDRLPAACNATQTGKDRALTVRLLDVLPAAPQIIEDLTKPCSCPPAIEYDVFSALRERLDRNLHKMSGVPYPPQKKGAQRLVRPTDFKGSPSEAVHGYLDGTPFESLFDLNIAFDIPDAIRFEHQWIVAGSGHGKTQCLQYQIARDLPRVARGECSVIVIDSQGDLIRNICTLKVFAPGQKLFDRLVLVDPSDVEYPFALNLFDVGQARLGQHNALDRERLRNSIIELYDFVLGSLLSAELTQKQSVIFRFLIRLMLQIPNATLHTFRELMEPQRFERYRAYVDQLEGTARTFFETEFNSKQFDDTKRQVLRRLWGILENPAFERMFANPKSKLDLFTEMNAGRIILINTAKDLLKETGAQVFGRFFIALIAQAAQERATLPEGSRRPCFVYIDEAADYFDQNVAMILETARKQKISLCCAHQYVGQLTPKLQESFAANTSIKMVGGVSDKDARLFAHSFRCSPEFILDQPKGKFACFIRNLTPAAVAATVPLGFLEGMHQMNDVEASSVQHRIRELYTERADGQSPRVNVQLPDRPELKGDPSAPGTW